MMTELVNDLVIKIRTYGAHTCYCSRLQAANTCITLGTEKTWMTILKFTIGALFLLYLAVHRFGIQYV